MAPIPRRAQAPPLVVPRARSPPTSPRLPVLCTVVTAPLFAPSPPSCLARAPKNVSTVCGSTFEMNPCIPSSWPEYSLVWRFGRTGYEIVVKNPERRYRGIAEAELDSAPVDPLAIPLVDDGGTHHLRLVLGDQKHPVPPPANLGAVASS